MAGENAMYGRSVEKQRGNIVDNRPFMAILKGETPEENVREYLEVGFRLRQQTGRPVLWWVSLDHFTDIFGRDYAEKALSELSAYVTHHGELAVMLAKPGQKSILQTVSNIAATHPACSRGMGPSSCMERSREHLCTHYTSTPRRD